MQRLLIAIYHFYIMYSNTTIILGILYAYKAEKLIVDNLRDFGG